MIRSIARDARRRTLIGAVAALGTSALGALAALPARAAEGTDALGVTHGAESIHQEVLFAASIQRVYRTLSNGAEFDRVVRASDAFSSMKLGKARTFISREVGGNYVAFGGYIQGRLVELVPSARIVVAWRTASWPAGVYSIARFELAAQGDSTLLVFDHSGFPNGEGAHLAEGWRVNYWEPMKKVLA
jgi:uncharacterized protein YndB with AHSA1/START domain